MLKKRCISDLKAKGALKHVNPSVSSERHYSGEVRPSGQYGRAGRPPCVGPILDAHNLALSGERLQAGKTMHIVRRGYNAHMDDNDNISLTVVRKAIPTLLGNRHFLHLPNSSCLVYVSVSRSTS